MTTGKLTKYDFVELFTESRKAGHAEYIARGGRLPVKEATEVRSTITGLFCAERGVLLIEYGVSTSAGVKLDELPKGKIETVTAMEVTTAVREMPIRADTWHGQIKIEVECAWPSLNPQVEDDTVLEVSVSKGK